MKVFVSNHLRSLSYELFKNIFKDQTDFFTKKWVIVPSEDIKWELYLHWLEKTDGIAGVKVLTHHQWVRYLFPDLPSHQELILKLYEALEQDSRDLKDYWIQGSSLRRFHLCDQLATLFFSYLKRPEKELRAWLDRGEWQQQLWKRVFNEITPTQKVRLFKGRLFFYHIKHISPYEWDALQNLDTQWYLFSPSQMYIGDLKNAQEQSFILKRLASNAREEMNVYFEDDSFLLSHWGSYDRKLFKLLENEELIYLSSTTPPRSMLGDLQTEWLLMEKKVSHSDTSLQIHSAPTRFREVEVVWELIQKLPYEPRDILILAPNIELYGDAIEWVFSHREHSAPYVIKSLKIQRVSPLLQGLEALFQLSKHRFSKDCFQKILLLSPFLENFDLTKEDAEAISTWMDIWGLRHDLSGHPGSWKNVLQRALEAFCVSETSYHLECSDSVVLDKWIDIFQKLLFYFSSDLESWEKKPSEWADWLEEVKNAFFSKELECEEFSYFIESLRSSCVVKPIRFEIFENLFLKVLSTRSGSILSESLQAVCFTSLEVGKVVPRKAIIVMGLEEGAFPRSFFPSTLEQLPSQSLSEEDRAIFLEAVSSAEEIFIMTYCRCHPEDGKEVRPSSVINEIVQDRGHIYTVHHPVSAFDLSYYQKEGFQSSSLYHQKITEAKLKKERISKETTLSLLNKKHEKERIYIRDLKKLARHPFQFYLEEGVGIQFPFDRNDSEFLFSRLEMARLRELCLHQPITSLIKKLEQEGKLPSGSFRDMAVQSIEEELLSYQQVIRVLNLDPSSFFSLELSPYCTKSMDISHGRKIVPSIKIQLEGGVTKEIVGVIDGLTNEGLVYHGEDSLENHLKLWPLYCLIQACLGQESHAIFLTKKGDICHKPLSNPLESLTRYLSYMEKCLRAPSPLLPEWGRRIFKESLIPDKSDDKIIDWASKRKLLPSCSIWLSHWKNDLHETFHELL